MNPSLTEQDSNMLSRQRGTCSSALSRVSAVSAVNSTARSLYNKGLSSNFAADIGSSGSVQAASVMDYHKRLNFKDITFQKKYEEPQQSRAELGLKLLA